MQGLAMRAVTLSLLGGAVGYSARGGAWAPSWAPTPRRPAPAVHMVETAALQLDADAETVQDWSWWLQRPRYPELRDIALSISVRRTVDEAELAVKLANEYSDPSLLQVRCCARVAPADARRSLHRKTSRAGHRLRLDRATVAG